MDIGVDVLALVRSIIDRAYAEYGDVLKAPFNQEETHLTWFSGDLLKRHDMGHVVIDGVTYYTEAAKNAAFVAGMRVGAVNGVKQGKHLWKSDLDDIRLALDRMEEEYAK